MDCRRSSGLRRFGKHDVTQLSTTSGSQDGSPILRASKRLFWLVMLLFHVGAIRAAWSGLFDPTAAPDWALGGIRLAVLIASAAFFALKIADVAALRLKSGWKPLVASIVVVALLHVNVLERAVESDSPYSPAPIAAMAIVGALVESSTLRRGLVRLSARLFRDESVRCRSAVPSILASRRTARERIPYQLMSISGLLLPRPPPVA